MANRNTAPFPVTGDAIRDVGGAIVRRRFTLGGQTLTNGMTLTAKEVLSMKPNNLRSLRDNGFLQIFPKAARSHLEADPATVDTKRHIINVGFGNYNVIEGKVMNDKPLTKAQAEALVAQLEMTQDTNPIPHPVVTEQASTSPASESSQSAAIETLRKN